LIGPLLTSPERSKSNHCISALTNARGNAYCKKGDIEHAIQDYDAQIKITRRHEDAYNGRGHAYAAKGNSTVRSRITTGKSTTAIAVSVRMSRVHDHCIEILNSAFGIAIAWAHRVMASQDSD